MLLLFIVACSALYVHPSDPKLQYVGRWTEEKQADWSGTAIKGNFVASFLNIHLSGGPHRFNVTIDGNSTIITGSKKIEVGRGTHAFSLVRISEALGPNPYTPHTFGVTTFVGLDLDGTMLDPPPRPSRRIEFIGDSLTAGYGDLGKSPCRFSPETEDWAVAWGALAANELNAEVYCEASSGYGICHNYGGKQAKSRWTMKDLWLRTLASDNSTLWDASQWVPDAVVVNLGSNDYSTEPHPTVEEFADVYSAFVQHVIKQYKSKVKAVFLACGPFCHDPCCDGVEKTAALLGGEKAGIFTVEFNGILHGKYRGCDGHPNVEGQVLMKDALVPTIKKVMKW